MATDTPPAPLPHLRFKRRVFVQIFEDIARETPNRVFSSIPRSDSLEDGFIDLTFGQAIVAVDYLGRWLKLQFGSEPTSKFETLTYLGVPDIRYAFLTLAAVKCGYKTLLPSPRNTNEINSSLMRQTQSAKLLYSEELQALALSLSAATTPVPRAIQVPSITEILAGRASPILYEPLFENALYDPIIVLHSSGSTGLPKPITYANGTVATLDADWSFRLPEGRKLAGLPLFVIRGGECRLFGPLPPSHLSGFYFKTVAPIMSLGIPVYPPATRLPSLDLVLEVIRYCNIQAAVLPPSVLEGISDIPDSLEQLSKLEWILYAGGPLSKAVGDQISKRTTLTPFYGSTEMLAIRQIVPRPEHWSYLEFHVDDGWRMEPIDDEIFELIALADPNAGPGNIGSAAIAYSLPGTATFHSRDLFKKHPQLDLWQFHGRKDDIIVLSSGEKINPTPMQTALETHAAIRGALIVGQGRSRAALLVEPEADQASNDDLEAEIWKAVQKNNVHTSGPGRISRDMILISDPLRPFVRTAKGNIVRRVTFAQYEGDIAKLFERATSRLPCGDLFDVSTATLSGVRDMVRTIVAEVLPGIPFTDESNLYLLGMDSLTTADAVAAMSRHIGWTAWPTPSTFYTNPSIEEMASVLYLRMTTGATTNDYDRTAEIEKVLSRRISEVCVIGNQGTAIRQDESTINGTSANEDMTVVITGTTGSLGSYLVAKLISQANVRHIICLNRSKDAHDKWKEKARSLSTSSVSPVFYTIDFSLPLLGLSPEIVREVCDCDVFIHNAWKVDFNQSLASYEDNLDGLKNIVHLWQQAGEAAHLVFVSSVSSVACLKEVPESRVTETWACAPMGYAESKFVAERVIDHAVAASPGLHATVLRVGQIAGSSMPGHAPWPEKEAFPGLFRTSRSLGLVPRDLPPVSWIPIDRAVDAIVEFSMSGHRSRNGAEYYNIVNPHPTPWNDLLEPIQEYCGAEAKIVPFEQWIQALKEFDRTDKRQLLEKPALKTIEFLDHLASYKGQAQGFSMSRALTLSQSLASLRPVDQTLMRQWLASI